MNIFLTMIPELLLLISALVVQLLAVCFKNKEKHISIMAISLSPILLICTYYYTVSSNKDLLNMMFFNNVFLKTFILTLSLVTITIYYNYTRILSLKFKTEFLTLVLLSTFGSFIAISARDFLLLFCAIELQALASYVLTGFDLKNPKSSEASLKFLIVGSIVTCFSLLGISFIYGFGGGLDFIQITNSLHMHHNIGLIIGLVLFISSILFKLSAAPLHFWSPDVYEAAPLPSVIFFATSQKITTLTILINIVNIIILDYKQIAVDLMWCISAFSMIIGSFGALYQSSIKRLIAYSTIMNIGYVLMGIATHNNDTINISMLYLIVYSISIMGFIICLILLFGNNSDITIESLKYVKLIARKRSIKILIVVITISMMGLPPFLGFFIKYYLFYQVFTHGGFILVFLALGTTLISCAYYPRIIVNLYFVQDEIGQNTNIMAMDITKTHINSKNYKILYFILITIVSILVLAPTYYYLRSL